ncbi:hypothetical protein [uncultured Mitsuokella sp.]|uniref:hypothetical protein n=1 Tax=uncultured Mitsuokella sp. TaxID=453120 RepID=UPI0026DC1AC3|nr:hypothetical protein [uncultured Mitsuokella sp.]
MDNNDEKIVVDEAQDAAEEQQEQKEAIPDELAGLSEDTAREIMQKAEQNESTEDEGEEQDEAPDESHAEQDSDNKPVETAPLPNAKIPYARFKQEVDKRRQLEERLAALEAQQKQAQPPAGNVQQAQQAPTPEVQQPPAPQLRFTPDVQKAFDATVDKQAMTMTGLSKEDVDAMEYMDDNDPRKTQYQTARKYAEVAIMQQIYAAQQEQQRRAKVFLDNHRKNIEVYNTFAQQEMQDPDFEQIKNYAKNEFFESLPESQQPVIVGAYTRIERQTANDADIMLIQNYFNNAKAAYRKNNPVQAASKNTTKQKMKQAVSMPRAGQVNGTSGYSGAVTGETLAEMMRTTPWGDIPEQYRNMILSAKTK